MLGAATSFFRENNHAIPLTSAITIVTTIAATAIWSVAACPLIQSNTLRPLWSTYFYNQGITIIHGQQTTYDD
jgi:hypothetical protein